MIFRKKTSPGDSLKSEDMRLVVAGGVPGGQAGEGVGEDEGVAVGEDFGEPGGEMMGYRADETDSRTPGAWGVLHEPVDGGLPQ